MLTSGNLEDKQSIVLPAYAACISAPVHKRLSSIEVPQSFGGMNRTAAKFVHTCLVALHEKEEIQSILPLFIREVT